MFASHIIYALIAGFVPSLIWLSFWLREDSAKDEPRSTLALCFVGGMIAVVVAGFIEYYVAKSITDPTRMYSIWAVVEEVLKFTVVAIIAIRGKRTFEPVDVMIYCVTAALGFAALENAMFIFLPLSHGDFVASLNIGNMRFIGAALLHVVSSSTVGFALGLVYYKSNITKVFAAIIGLILASGLHIFFNLSIINANSGDILKTFAWIWATVVILIVLFEEVKAVKPKPATE